MQAYFIVLLDETPRPILVPIDIGYYTVSITSHINTKLFSFLSNLPLIRFVHMNAP
jgi:hypothetical protein